MIGLFTDFGCDGLYTGQVRAVLLQGAPGVPIIEVLSNAPKASPKPSAYLLAAYCRAYPPGTVFLCVVDPGVGGGRRPVILEAGGRWFVGPDNGLLAIAARRWEGPRWWVITWRPGRLSATFHGRDLFAPVAAMLAMGEPPPGEPCAPSPCPWPDDLPEVIYFDHYGNAITGLRAASLPQGAGLKVKGLAIPRARTFSDVPPGHPLCYENANGLMEIALSSGSAREGLGLAIGDEVER